MHCKDIIVISSYRHENNYTHVSALISKELVKGNRVFFINNPSTIKDFKNKRNSNYFHNDFKMFWDHHYLKDRTPFFYNIVPPLTLPINFLRKGKLYNFLQRFNRWWSVERTIKKLIREHRIERPIIWNSYNPAYWIDVERSHKIFKNQPPQWSIYQTVDNIAESLYLQKHGTYLEEDAICDADAVLTTSIKLKEYAKSLLADEFHKYVHCIPNGADVEFFNRGASKDFDLPEEMKNMPHEKTIMYYGNIDQRTNYTVLDAILTGCKANLVLVGQQGTDDLKKSGLIDHPNLILTGPQHYEKLPQFISHADVTIIPYKINDLTSTIYPLKINEYLASGKEVVTTPFSADIIKFGDIIHVEKNAIEFALTIRELLEKNTTPERRQQLMDAAANNSWEARAEQFSEVIDNLSK